MALNKGFFEIEYQKIEINEKIGLGNLIVRRSPPVKINFQYIIIFLQLDFIQSSLHQFILLQPDNQAHKKYVDIGYNLCHIKIFTEAYLLRLSVRFKMGYDFS